MNELNNKDYKHILEFYNIPIPKSNKILGVTALNILSNKLCRCIKKISNKKKQKKAIAICTKTIINKKGFLRGKFTCKEKKTIIIKKNKTKKNNYYSKKK